MTALQFFIIFTKLIIFGMCTLLWSPLTLKKNIQDCPKAKSLYEAGRSASDLWKQDSPTVSKVKPSASMTSSMMASEVAHSSTSPGRLFEKEKSPFLEVKAQLRPTATNGRHPGVRSALLPQSSPVSAPEWKTKTGQLKPRQKPLSLQGADSKHKAGTNLGVR